MKVKAVYAGKRLTTKNDLAHAWLFEGEDKMRLYTKNIAPASIGETWQFEQTEEKSILLGPENRPEAVDGIWKHKDSIAWEAKEAADIADLAHIRVQKKLAKRSTQFEQSIRPLKAMMDTIGNHLDRAAFVQAVVAELWKR